MLRGRFRILTLAVLAVLSIALLAACDNGDDDTPDLPEPTAPGNGGTPGNGETPNGNGGAPDGDVTLTMMDIAFDQTELSISAGEEVVLALMNEGALLHDISIDEIPVEYSVSGDAQRDDGWDLHVALNAGASGAITMTVSEPGEYTYYCSVPGHREAGMEGTLTVQ